jgi:phosphoribosylanthranilate isomerase
MFVKICGTTTEEDALLAVALGADAVGFIFAPSPRQVTPVTAADIVKRLPPEIVTVGVFRGESPQRIVDTMQQCGLRAAQLHGTETAEQTRWIRGRVPMVMKAFAAGDPAIARAGDFGADAVLLDSASPGSGVVFDWRLAEDVPPRTRLLLAGGLHPDNVRDAVKQVKPWGVDVCSGVESAPGRKDPRRLRAFVLAAKAAGDELRQRGGDAGGEGPEPYDWQQDGARW